MACVRKVALPVDGSEHSERACDCTYFKHISDYFIFLPLVCALVFLKLAFVRVRVVLHAWHRNRMWMEKFRICCMERKIRRY